MAEMRKQVTRQGNLDISLEVVQDKLGTCVQVCDLQNKSYSIPRTEVLRG